MAVEVAVSSNKVLWYKFSSIWKICVIFNQKMESKNKKMTKSLPKHYVFFVLLLLCFEISCSSKLLIGGRESFENDRGFWWMWPWMLVRTWQHCESSGHRQYTQYSWRESSRLIRQNGGSVLLVNVVENWDAVLASPRPWQSPDCIPIVGAVLSL